MPRLDNIYFLAGATYGALLRSMVLILYCFNILNSSDNANNKNNDVFTDIILCKCGWLMLCVYTINAIMWRSDYMLFARIHVFR